MCVCVCVVYVLLLGVAAPSAGRASPGSCWWCGSSWGRLTNVPNRRMPLPPRSSPPPPSPPPPPPPPPGDIPAEAICGGHEQRRELGFLSGGDIQRAAAQTLEGPALRPEKGPGLGEAGCRTGGGLAPDSRSVSWRLLLLQKTPAVRGGRRRQSFPQQTDKGGENDAAASVGINYQLP